MEINYAIHWIVIYPVDSAIQRLNNLGLYVCLTNQHYLCIKHKLLTSFSENMETKGHKKD